MEKTIRLILILTVSALSLHAGQSDNTVLTLQDCIQIAMKENPLIQSSQQQYQASLARIHQAKAFSQPTLNWDSDLQPGLFDFKKNGEWYFGMSQTLEFPGKQYVRGKIASREADEILQEIELLKLDIAYQVKQSFHGMLLAREKKNYAELNLELSQDFQAKAELKLEAGEVAKVEVLRARVETSKAANEVRAADNEIRLARARLNFLLARRKYQPLEIAGAMTGSKVPLDLAKLKDQALRFRPEVKKINFSMQREGLQKKSASMNWLPDFELGVNRHKVAGEGSWWDVTLSFPIPLFFWQPKKGEIAEAEANIRSLKKEHEHLINAISLEVEESFMNASVTGDQIKLYQEDILDQAQEVYDMFLFSYQEGEIGGIELIEARRTLIDARISYAEAIFNYRLALAALDRAVGQSYLGGQQ